MKNLTFVIAIMSVVSLASYGEANEKSGQIADPRPYLAKPAEKKTSLNMESLDTKVSYMIGFSNIQWMKDMGIEIDIEAFDKGVVASLENAESAINDEDAEALYEELEAQLRIKALAEIEETAAATKAKSEAFLAENATKEGVVVTDSGLQYKVIKATEGEKPTTESIVQVRYEGRLTSGDVFDSYKKDKGTPFTLPLSEAIDGWVEGLQLMSEGSTYELYIPSDLAFGSKGGGNIGPNEALIYVLELIEANYEDSEEKLE